MSDKARMSGYTKKLRAAFPSWSAIRKNPDSVGAQFLATMGMRLDDVQWMLAYAHDQYYLGTADVTQADLIYKAQMPTNIKPETSIRVQGGAHILEQAKTTEAFLMIAKNTQAESPTITYRNYYMIDFESKFLYVLKPYDVGEPHVDGHITLSVFDDVQRQIIQQDALPLKAHHVWNFFDEFGLLLGLSRLPKENNINYKKRLLDVFQRPANSTKQGLLNAVVRELGLTKEATWPDGGTPLSLRTARVDLNSIRINNEPFPLDMILYDNSGRVILQGLPQYAGIERIVTYNAAVTFHELHDRGDQELQAELFNVDGTATPLLQYYVDVIGDRIPVMWGQWKWGQGFWDIADEQVSGYGKIPTFTDAKISGWTGYNPQEV